MSQPLLLHPDRLAPVDSMVRNIARALYMSTYMAMVPTPNCTNCIADVVYHDDTSCSGYCAVRQQRAKRTDKAQAVRRHLADRAA